MRPTSEVQVSYDTEEEVLCLGIPPPPLPPHFVSLLQRDFRAGWPASRPWSQNY